MLRVGYAVCFVLLVPTCYAGESADEHPLAPLLKYAQRRLQEINSEIKDYTCILVTHERIDGYLSTEKFARVKLRHEQRRHGVVVVPFSVYLRFLGPAEVKDREVIYVRGRNKGKLIARKGGRRFKYITVAIDPLGDLAMHDSRYPVTAVGIKSLVERLVEVGKEDLQYDEIEVKYFPGAKVNQRVCTAITVTHPVRRDHFRYHVAQIFIDEELQLPIRFASYDWPKEEGGKPRLLEEYTFLDLKLNVGLTDSDFDHRNQEYGFRKNFVP